MKISRRSFSTMVASGAAAMAVGAPASASARKGNVVLVHGAYADGSCWSKVIPLLQNAGVTVTAVQHPLTSLEAGAAATRRALDLQTDPTVLVGHSFGGSVITEAGDHPLVSSLVYLSARAPDVGEDYGALAAKFPTPPANAGLVYHNGFGGLTERAFLNDFANGVPRHEARVLYAAQGRIAQTLFTDRTTAAAWKAKPTRYLITTDDRTTNPQLQRFVAKRMGAQTAEVSTGHLSFIVRPSLVARFILDALP
ncbi:alpha/beta fold hydrolase [Kibdelosporangium aridum]|uniref:Pimeloyl-ACP methyl ester carboxylesterase n=1 Tax=Kibdelosporangium aridum TaxID=2030 RepID=A0A1W2F9J4_KIBAR|nr:alpha/beta hydrolase [Kibdelosporangium aridum]SMD18298.1 Pimeloyl-ACP methyl ester carboxylesterase [Kibdelosporangium aridum]